MRTPDFRHIIAFIAEKNSFVTQEEIVANQITKSGKSRGVVRPYIYTALKRLEKKGQVISIKDFGAEFTLWGLPGWIDFFGSPLYSHRPLGSSIEPRPSLFNVSSHQKQGRAFFLKKKPF